MSIEATKIDNSEEFKRDLVAAVTYIVEKHGMYYDPNSEVFNIKQGQSFFGLEILMGFRTVE